MRKNGASPDARGRRAAVRAFGPQIRRARAQLVSTYNYRARAILAVVITGSRTLRGHDRGTTTTARRIPSFARVQGAAKTKIGDTHDPNREELRKSIHPNNFVQIFNKMPRYRERRCISPSYPSFTGQLAGVRVLQRCECGAFGSLRLVFDQKSGHRSQKSLDSRSAGADRLRRH